MLKIEFELTPDQFRTYRRMLLWVSGFMSHEPRIMEVVRAALAATEAPWEPPFKITVIRVV